MQTLTHLQKYRQLRSQVRKDSRGKDYLVLESLWRKWDATLNPLGLFVLYPDSAEMTLKRLETFQAKFEARDGLEISRLPDESSRSTWQGRRRSGGLFTHRAVAQEKNFAVVTFHPPGRRWSSAVWIHEADLASVIEFIRAQLGALAASPPAAIPSPDAASSGPAALAERHAPPVNPSPEVSAFDRFSENSDLNAEDESLSKEIQKHEAASIQREEHEFEKFEDAQQEFAQKLEEMEDAWRLRQECYTASLDEALRDAEEGWPYADTDPE